MHGLQKRKAGKNFVTGFSFLLTLPSLTNPVLWNIIEL